MLGNCGVPLTQGAALGFLGAALWALWEGWEKWNVWEVWEVWEKMADGGELGRKD